MEQKENLQRIMHIVSALKDATFQNNITTLSYENWEYDEYWEFIKEDCTVNIQTKLDEITKLMHDYIDYIPF